MFIEWKEIRGRNMRTMLRRIMFLDKVLSKLLNEIMRLNGRKQEVVVGKVVYELERPRSEEVGRS